MVYCFEVFSLVFGIFVSLFGALGWFWYRCCLGCWFSLVLFVRFVLVFLAFLFVMVAAYALCGFVWCSECVLW